jgi:hypothetical protein
MDTPYRIISVLALSLFALACGDDSNGEEIDAGGDVLSVGLEGDGSNGGADSGGEDDVAEQDGAEQDALSSDAEVDMTTIEDSSNEEDIVENNDVVEDGSTEDTADMGPGDAASEPDAGCDGDVCNLCEETGGRWDRGTCGHYQCGYENSCDALIPGCDCGSESVFNEGDGCGAAVMCDDWHLCVDTGGEFLPLTCDHWLCGERPTCRAIIPGCNCGDGANFSDEGCAIDEDCGVCPDWRDPTVHYSSEPGGVCEEEPRCLRDQSVFSDVCGCGCIDRCPVPGPRVRYAGDNPEACSVIGVACRENEIPFDNECGCGCLELCPDPADEGVVYTSTDPEHCELIRLDCGDEGTPFNNDCGCGCLN